jgi:hypothetical protein
LGILNQARDKLCDAGGVPSVHLQEQRVIDTKSLIAACCAVTLAVASFAAAASLADPRGSILVDRVRIANDRCKHVSVTVGADMNPNIGCGHAH